MEKSKKQKSEYYVSVKEITKEIKHFKLTGEITDNLGIMITKIAKRYATKYCFSGYTFKDEFIQDAIYRMLTQLDKIDITHPRCNIFAYLTQTTHNCFISRITKEKRYQHLKNTLKNEYITETEHEENINFKSNPEEDI